MLDHYKQISLLIVRYSEVVADPDKTAIRVNEFLGGGFEKTAMARAVEPKLYRHKN